MTAFELLHEFDWFFFPRLIFSDFLYLGGLYLSCPHSERDCGKCWGGEIDTKCKRNNQRSSTAWGTQVCESWQNWLSSQSTQEKSICSPWRISFESKEETRASKCYCYRNSSSIHPAISITQLKCSAFNRIRGCFAKFWTGNEDGTLKCIVLPAPRQGQGMGFIMSILKGFLPSLKVKKEVTVPCWKLCQRMSSIICENRFFLSEVIISFSGWWGSCFLLTPCKISSTVSRTPTQMWKKKTS